MKSQTIRSIASFFFVLGLIPQAAWTASSRTYSFADIWSLVKASDPSLRAADEETSAARILAERKSRHWYPRLFGEARAFQTNDPAVSFMSALNQRSISASDFAPDSLNHPGASFFEKGSLGMELPIFEGGAAWAEAVASQRISEARLWDKRAQILARRSQVARNYAILLIHAEEQKHLEDLQKTLAEILHRYRVGEKSNPLGYSGLLGLKSLANRLQLVLLENETQSLAITNLIRTWAGDLSKDWKPREALSEAFLAEVFSDLGGDDGSSFLVKSALAQAEATSQWAVLERAKFLPHLGVFLEGDLYRGERNSATSYSAGVYLRWDLFSATNWGALDQAHHETEAARARAAHLKVSSQVSVENARASLKNLQTSLSLIDDSLRLLREQTINSRALFQNGVINALQLVEVFSHRADLVMSRSQTAKALAEAYEIVASHSGERDVGHED
jgi:outer membrane protein TolC